MAITPLPTPPSRQDPANFAERADTFLNQLPTFATEANALASMMNADKIDVQTNTNTTLTARDTTLTARDTTLGYRNEAEVFKDQAEATVSALPDGSINDLLISTTDTWSSQKIDSEIDVLSTEIGPLATELEMQEGTSTEVRRMSPALIKQSQPNFKTVNGEEITGNGEIVIASKNTAFSSF